MNLPLASVTLGFVLGSLSVPAVAQSGSALYRVTFDATWSATSHPVQFPTNPHFSPLVGGTHSAGVSFWSPGSLASPGIEQMAETGATSPLVGEVQQQITAGNADQVLNFGGAGMLGTSPGQLSVTFAVDAAFPRCTLVAMLAPSPDWFVGVHDLDLRANGDWIEQLVVPLNVYDAGSDSGVSYNSPDMDMQPPAPIAIVTTAAGPFQGASTVVGTFTIERQHGTLVYGCSNPAGSLSVAGTAQLGQNLLLTLADPTGQLPTPAVAGLALSGTAPPLFPCGTSLPGFGLAHGTSGEVLLGSVDALVTGPTYAGAPVTMPVAVPNNAALLGQSFWLQGLLASSRVGLTRALAAHVGL